MYKFLYLAALVFAILFMCLGYTLDSLIDSAYHTHRKAVRHRWALEVAKHQALRARHEEHERQRHDDEIKKREGISWEGLAAARCLRYATREYTAVLAHVPLGFDALEECRKKTINIHGRDLLPSRCEDKVGDYTQRDNPLTGLCLKGTCGRVTGHWDVDFEEPGCVTWWQWFDDKV